MAFQCKIDEVRPLFSAFVACVLQRGKQYTHYNVADQNQAMTNVVLIER